MVGVPMGFLDFAPEPPAPTATPVKVTESVNLNCTSNNDARDLSNLTSNGDVRIKFETLRSLDPETLEIDNRAAPVQYSLQQLDHYQQISSQYAHHPSQQQQQQQQQQQIQNHQGYTQHIQHHIPHSQAQLINTIKIEPGVVVKQEPELNIKEEPHSPHNNLSNQAQNQIHSQQMPSQPSTPHQQQSQSNNATPMQIDHFQQISGQQHNNHYSVQQVQQIHNQQMPSQPSTPHQQQPPPSLQTANNEVDLSIVKQETRPKKKKSKQNKNHQMDTSEDTPMHESSSDRSSPQYTNLTSQNEKSSQNSPKTWTQEDMDSALEALRSHNMSLTKASMTYRIPSTTLWQRAHRLGIDTQKKDGPTKSWNEDSLNSALNALRTGQISANKASKAYGIPSSTLYKIARREGIRLAAPFNAAPTTWSPEDLERALEAIRGGHTSVQKASAEFGIPTGTLYGRCKREGIELSRSNPTPWSEDIMLEALESVRLGQMSVNQAAVNYNLPYSSLYGRFKRGKFDTNGSSDTLNNSQNEQQAQPNQQAQVNQQQQHTQQTIQTHQSVPVTQTTQAHHITTQPHQPQVTQVQQHQQPQTIQLDHTQQHQVVQLHQHQQKQYQPTPQPIAINTFQYNPGPSTIQALQQNPHLHQIQHLPHMLTSQSPLLNLNLHPQQIQIHHIQHPLSRQQM